MRGPSPCRLGFRSGFVHLGSRRHARLEHVFE
jgi:hypothetical protein